MLRYSREELGRLTWADVTHPDDLATDLAQFNRVLTGKIDRYYLEKRFLRKDGEIVEAVIATHCIRQPNGAVDYLVNLVLDLTERKRAERTLRDHEQRWRRALDGAGQGVWDWNTVTSQVFFSPQWKAMLGYGEREIGDGLEEWETRVHPDDFDGWRQALQRHFAGETPTYQHEYRIMRKNGQYQWVLDRGMVFEWSADHQPLRVVGTLNDITQRKEVEEKLHQSEERYRVLYEHAADAIIVLDPLGQVISVNEQACRQYGYAREEFLALNISALSPSEETLRAPAQRAKSQRNGQSAFKAVHQDAQGRPFPVEVTSRKIVVDGKPCTMNICRDLTEHQR